VAGAGAFFAELKRRNVLRAAVLYAGAVWALAQGISQLAPAFGAPGWITRWFVIAAIIGFPFWIVFAWFYELTPLGLKRGSEIAPADSIAPATGRKLDFWIIAVLAVAVVLLVTNQFVLRRDATSAAEAADAKAAAARIPGKSVAVLPFANAGGKQDERFFSDGLSEDLITALSQFSGLKVINRESAFQFRDSKDPVASIGAKLGVAHLLEGSVRRREGEVRISAELIAVDDGSIVWSQHYDKPYKDLFALQDAITDAVAKALKAKLLTTAGAVVQSERPPGGNLEAYTAYLRGLGDYRLSTEKDLRDAIAAFGEAIRIDPDYAAAYARLAGPWCDLASGYLGGAQSAQAYASARAAVNTALVLAPDSALAHRAKSTLLLNAKMDWTGAEAEARRALELAPNDASARYALGSLLIARGQLGQAISEIREALVFDPRYSAWYNGLAQALIGLGRLDEARQAIGTAVALRPGAVVYREQLVTIEVLRNDAGAALAIAQQEPPGPFRDIEVTQALQIGKNRVAADAALQKLIADYASDGAYQIAQVYGIRRDPDQMFHWLSRAWTNRDAGIGSLLADPFILPYRNDPRFAALCREAGLPTTTDGVAIPRVTDSRGTDARPAGRRVGAG
jgi:TolB-like protein/Flp pilus assembly protein TadD